MSKRILIVSLAVTVLVLLVFSVTSVEIYHNISVEEADEALETYMSIYENGAYTADQNGVDALSSVLGGVRVTFFTSEGHLIADSASPLIPDENIGNDDMNTLKIASELFSKRDSEITETEVMYYKRSGDVIVRISVVIPSTLAMYGRALPHLIVFLILDVLLCMLLTWLATSFILRPVKELAASAIGTNEEIKANYKELQPVADVINKKNESVRQMQSSKDEFIANVTHEMNTPLTSIRGFAELIASGSLSKEKTQKAGKTIVEQSARLSGMITQILHFSAIDDDMLESYDVDVSELVRELLGTYQPLLKDKNLTLTSDIEDGCIVATRRERVTEILDNLVSNAAKYNVRNGKISVTLRGGKLTVADTGIGIAREELPHVFSRFYTVDKSHGENVGFGLGLSIVRKICDRSGWKLGVDSTPGEGTEFSVNFRG